MAWGNGWPRRRQTRTVVIALGVLIGGDTNHHETGGAERFARACQQVALATRTPVINGVIVANNDEAGAGPVHRPDQPRVRSSPRAALEMAALKRTIGRPKS